MIVHADLKPSNILVNELGEPKLIDFGIALNQKTDAEKERIKAASLDFSSPEQSSGEALSSASDIFSLGKLLQFLLKTEVLCKDLELIIEKATRIDVKARFASVLQMQECLDNLLMRKPISLRKDEKLYVTKLFFKRTPLAVLSLLLFFGFIVYFIASYVKLEQQKEEFFQLATYFERAISIGNNQQFTGRQTTIREVIQQAGEDLREDTKLNAEQKHYLATSYMRSLSRLSDYKAVEKLALGINFERSDRFNEKDYLYIDALSKLNKVDEGREFFLKSLSSKPLNTWALKSASTIVKDLVATDKFETLDALFASIAWNKIENKFKDSTQLLLLKSEVSLNKGELKLAEDYLTKIETELSRSEEIEKVFLLALLAEKQGLLNNAKEYYSKSLSLIKNYYGEYHPVYVMQLLEISRLNVLLDKHIEAHDLLKDRPYRLFTYYKALNQDVAKAWFDLAASKSSVIEYEQRLHYLEKAKAVFAQLTDENRLIAADLAEKIDNLEREIHREEKMMIEINRAQISHSAEPKFGFLLPYKQKIVENQYASNAVFYPNDESIYQIGRLDYVRWDQSEIKGTQVSLFLLRTNKVLDQIAAERQISLDWFNNQSFERFAHNVENTGNYTFDPNDLKANGKGLKIFVVSNLGYWGFSQGSFEVLSGKARNNGILTEINEHGLVDAIEFPQRKEAFYWAKPTAFKWNKTLLLGDKVTLYVLHDDPSGMRGGTSANLPMVLQRRWYPFAVNIPNTGFFDLDPAIMEGRGNKYKLLLVTELGYWALSNTTFSIWEIPKN